MKRKKIGYPPLNILQSDLVEFGDYFHEIASTRSQTLQGLSKQEFIDFILSDDFLVPTYKGKYQELNDESIKVADYILHDICEMDDEAIKADPVLARTEVKDYLLIGPVFGKWGINKVSYRPDGDFLDVLSGTGAPRLTNEDLLRLPTQTFYVDLTDLKGIGSLHGMLIDVNIHETDAEIAMFVVDRSLCVFSCYVGGAFRPDKTLMDGVADRKGRGYDVGKSDQKKVSIDIEHIVKDRKTLAIIGMQMIAYLSSQKPDIKEPEGGFYRKRQAGIPAKNRFSEVHSFDVGVRFGSSFRKIKQERGITGYVSSTITGRRSPIPHFRSAHWQTFHVGPGRQETVQLWIEPVFVGGKEAKDVVIRKIKEGK